jgi:hypothetical protein
MARQARVVIERRTFGPEARCMVTCQFFAWRGEHSPLLADEVRSLARQHVLETGHPVEITTTLSSVYKEADDATAD